MSLFSPLIFIFTVIFCYETSLLQHQVNVDGKHLLLGPHLSANGRVILYNLDQNGIFHRSSPIIHEAKEKIVYSVLKNGILIAEDGPYAISYKVNKKGDLVPLPSNTCIYKTDQPALYLEGIGKMLIPVEVVYAGDHINYIQGGNRLIYSEKLRKFSGNLKMVTEKNDKSVEVAQNSLIPDKSCAGDVILFLLNNNGVFARNPPDEFIPNGMKLKYELQDNGSLIPKASKNGFGFTYITSENGNLQPSTNNSHTLTTLRESTKSFILGQGGVIAPVSEFMDLNKTVKYFFDGKLVHSSNQFRKVFSNSSILVLSEKDNERNDTEVQPIQPGPKFECPLKTIAKRDTAEVESNAKTIVKRATTEVQPDSKEVETFKRKPAPDSVPYTFDENGKRILIEPFVFDGNSVAVYKLTCKGHLKRMAPYKEPDCGYEVIFKLLESLVLVPVRKGTCSKNKLLFRYILNGNGNLMPVQSQENSLKKAPASMLYFILGKNRDLIPVRLHIDKTNDIQCYFQDILIHTIPADIGKEMELFTTVYVPQYCYVNNRIVVGYYDQIPKTSCNGATWSNPNQSGEEIKCPSKNLYLLGPKGTKILLIPYINENGVPVVYEMDCSGVCHKSPKDDNKHMVFKCFKLLTDGILMPHNGSKGYMYLVDKLGNMCPYYYPETKLRACFGQTIKYVLCKDGILLPCLIRIYGDYLQYCFEDVVIYCKKTFTIEQIMELQGEKKSCKTKTNDDDDFFNLFIDKNGNIVYYERCGDEFIRHPPSKIGSCVLHSIGYYEILKSGTLKHAENHPDNNCNYIQCKIEKDGNMYIMSRSHENEPKGTDFVLDKNANLIPVTVKKTEGKSGCYYKFYKDGVRIFKQKCENWEPPCPTKPPKEAPTPSGMDPMGIFKDKTPPESCKKCKKEPECVHIPMKEVTFTGKLKCAETERCKCEQMKKTVQDVMAKDASSHIQIDIDDNMAKHICDIANKCSGTTFKSRGS